MKVYTFAGDDCDAEDRQAIDEMTEQLVRSAVSQIREQHKHPAIVLNSVFSAWISLVTHFRLEDITVQWMPNLEKFLTEKQNERRVSMN